jgi:transcriptional regulator NrdR family protein
VHSYANIIFGAVIALMILEKLKELDPLAYVRNVMVYLNICDAQALRR